MLVQSTTEVVGAILGSIDEAIHAVDEHGITIFYNAVAARHDGLAVEEVLGKHVLEAFPSLTRETSTLLQVLETKKKIPHQVQRYQNRNGHEIYTVNTTIPILLDGRVAGAVEIAKDYSTIRKLTDTIVDLQASMKRTSSRSPVKKRATFADIITNDPQFLQTKRLAQKVARTDATVLIYGETGTGKELFVQAIHEASLRKDKPFIAQNCAALPESLLESLLFGTTKGSYTGAVDRAGLFELADGGTLFLDEINSMPLNLQAKLLRVLEDDMIRRIGDSRTRKVDVRVIAAINEAPEICLQKQHLRTDLYYRLHVFSLSIPLLRERKDDILLLAYYFLHQYNQKLSKQVTEIDADVQQLFLHYHWPGNVRELKHTMEHAMIVTDCSIITPSHLPSSFHHNTPKNQPIMPLREALLHTEQQLIDQAMKETEGNIMQAAKLLDIPRQTLQYKLQKHTKAARK
ncbi:sigma-54 interaction domain-containing protein [Microbacteriaceae bacterium 4G12]